MREAYAREIVRRVQEMRKEIDLDVEEFIEVSLSFDENKVAGFTDYIKSETRAKSLVFGESLEGYTKSWEIEGEEITITIKRLKTT
jgi:isoleucyl-tRNA synthetase